MVQFNPVTKDVMTREIEAEPLLNPSAHVIPMDDDDPEIIPDDDDDDDDESIVGWNPVAGGAANQNPGIPPVPANPNATATQNANTTAVPPSTGGTASSGRVTGGMSAVEKQMKRLQIDMTDTPARTVQATATTVYETGTDSTTECVFNVSVNSDPGDPNSTAEAIFDEYDNFTKSVGFLNQHEKPSAFLSNVQSAR